MLVVALLLPLVLHDYLTVFATRVVILALFALSFDMVWGYAGIMSFGKNRAKLVPEDSKRVTFSDVAGVDEAKEELTEIIEFLKTPQKFRAIGGKTLRFGVGRATYRSAFAPPTGSGGCGQLVGRDEGVGGHRRAPGPRH